MSVPTNELVYAGVWSATTSYPQYQFVQSPIDGNCYVNVNIQPAKGGADPSVQPSAFWVLIPEAVGGIVSLNGLTQPALSITSSNFSVGVSTIAPDKVDLIVAGTFAPAFGSFSSTQTQDLNPAFPVLAELPLIYDTKDCTSVGLTLALPTADIQMDYKGTYKILASLQVDKTTGGNGEIDMYVVVNGTAVPNTATKLNLNQNEESVMTVEWFLDLNAGDKLRINCYSTADGVRVLAVAPNPPVPAIPSVITTILRIA
jgi:hypothetical protein